MTNIIDIYFDSVGSTATAPSKLWQWSKGQIVRINGLDLPAVYQVHFSNNPTLGTAEPVAVSGNMVSIPDIYLTTGEPVYLFIWLSDETSAETIRKGTIYVAKRSQPSGEYDPTAEQQTIIDGLIGSINTAVDTAEGYADSAQTYSGNAATSATEALNAKDAAQGYAEQASQTAQGVEILVNRAEDAADDAETAKQDVEQLKQAVEGLADDAESAKTDAETARGEAQGFTQTASTKASEASQSASQASQSATTAISQAQTATAKATEANQSAETATAKASEASASAATATTKASEASTSASTATTAKNDAVTAKNAAVTARTGAETARTGAEAAAQSVSASAAQIATNASDITDLKEDLTDVTVDGYNLIKIAEHGVGAYYANGSRLVYEPSYTGYHYAIMPVEKNSRYYVSNVPRWWVLTDDNDAVLSSGAGFNPGNKRYIDTGNATKFYYTIDNGSWNNEATYGVRYALIVSKSNTGSGSRDNVSKPKWLSGLSQRMFDSKYAFAFNRTRLKFTKNANKKFYFKNLLALDSNYAEVSAGYINIESITKDYISITYTSTGEKAIVGMVFDANLSLVEQQSDIKANVANDNLSNCSALVIGDSTVAQNTMTQKMLDAFTARDKTLTLLGTRGTAPNLHEGRSGWSAKQYCTQSADNPFYNNGFDFSHYMTAQGYSAVDFVVLQIGINDLYNANIDDSVDKIAETMGYVCTMIDSILAWNASQKIIVNLLTPVNPNYTGDYMYTKRNIFVRYNAQMLLEITKYNIANVRPSDTFAILDPESDISDNVHPTAVGYEKMANEVVSQINCWQNGV